MTSSAPCVRKRLDQLRHQASCARSKTRGPHNMHIILNGLLWPLPRASRNMGDKSTSKPHVRKRRGHHFGAPVVTVLPHLCDQHARPRPCCSTKDSISMEMPSQLASSAYAAPYTPETVCALATNRPYTLSSASEISPTVARQRVALTARSSKLPSPDDAASVSAIQAAAARCSSRTSRTSSPTASCASRTCSLSISRISTASCSSI